MSDNPTLWVRMNAKAEPATWSTAAWREASRADVLAALPDKAWWCHKQQEVLGVTEDCTPEHPHSEPWFCHWAVKP